MPYSPDPKCKQMRVYSSGRNVNTLLCGLGLSFWLLGCNNIDLEKPSINTDRPPATGIDNDGDGKKASMIGIQTL